MSKLTVLWLGLIGLITLVWIINQPVPRCKIVGDHEFNNGKCIPYCPPNPSECVEIK